MRTRLASLALAGTLSFIAAGALAQAEAERRLDAALERLRQNLGADARLTTGTRQIDPVTGRARLGDVVVTAGDRRLTVAEALVADLTEARLGRAELSGLVLTEGKGDRAELARLVVAGLPIPPPGTAITLAATSFDSLLAEGLRSQSARGTLSAGRLVAEGYAPGRLASGTLEGLDFKGPATDVKELRVGRIAVQALTMPVPGTPMQPTAFTVESLTLEGGRVVDPGQNVTVEAGRFVLRDWVPGRLTDLVAEGLRVAAPIGAMGQGDLRIGRATSQGIDGAATLASFLGSTRGPDPQPGTPQRILVEGVAMQAAGQPLLEIARIAAEGDKVAAGYTSGLLLEGFRAFVPRGSAPWLDQAGYQQVAGGLEIRAALRPEGGLLTVDPYRMTWDDAGTLTLAVELAGTPAYPAAGAPMVPEAYAAEMANARLASATLRYRDQGLLGRAIAVQARAQRVPEARVRESWAQMAMALPMPGSAPSSAPAAKGSAAPADEFAAIRQAIAAFIRQPREIEFALRPAKPVVLSEIPALGAAGPAAAIRSMGLTVRLP